MNKREFIAQLFMLYPSKNPNVEAQIKFYDEVLENSNFYDYEAFLHFIGREYKYSHTPSTQWLMEYREQFRYKRQLGSTGELINITFEKNNFSIQAVPDGPGNISKEVLRKLQNLYGKITSIKRYPKGTVIIGNTVWLPD